MSRPELSERRATTTAARRRFLPGSRGSLGVFAAFVILGALLSPRAADAACPIQSAGCCDGNTFKFCGVNQEVVSVACDFGRSCGYHPGFERYDCGFDLPASDPNGVFPRQCPCIPQCNGKSCGPDGCGGTCGTCADNGLCDEQTGKCSACPIPKGCCTTGPWGQAGEVRRYCSGGKIVENLCRSSTFTHVCGWRPDWNWTGEGYHCDNGNMNGADPSGTYPVDCAAYDCQPSCAGKNCGDDGCGGSCGTCSGQNVCNTTAGRCECVPNCDGKSCGDDGCGGSCGSCEYQVPCVGGACVPRSCGGITKAGCCDGNSRYWCGDNGRLYDDSCGSFGPAFSCGWQDAPNASDSGFVCGVNLPAGAPDGRPRTCNCTPQCDGKSCGDDGCGGQCGFCKAGDSCVGGACQGAVGSCQYVPDNGCCSGDSWYRCENNRLYTFDCSRNDATCNVNASSPDGAQMGCSTTTQPDVGYRSCCFPNCTGKECGDDGCGGSCGSCGATEACQGGTCVCVPRCDGKVCGDDGCGGTCGSCGAGTVCVDDGAACCDRQCEGKECGPDGCGGTCGSCLSEGTSATCSDGQCVCRPSCDGKTCGDDGCGGSCGRCNANELCQGGSCVCQPSCDGKSCGSDGCGGSCGTCTSGNTCLSSGACCTPDCDGKSCGSDGCGGFCGGCKSDEICHTESGTCRQPACDDIPAEGCCDGTLLRMCAKMRDRNGNVVKTEIFSSNCRENGAGYTCGWSSSGQRYGCGRNLSASDPSGNAPRACDLGCTPNCENRACGDDGCGGSCGSCDSGEKCDEAVGQCKESPCADVPAAGCCAGNARVMCDTRDETVDVLQCGSRAQDACGWNGSGYTCGQSGRSDPNGAVKACPADLCIPQCDGKSCGDDGCGGTCGTCPTGHACSADGKCVPPCVRDCTNKDCGSDGCGGVCGTNAGGCPSDKVCGGSGQCMQRDLCGGIPAAGCCEGRKLKTCAYPSAPQVDDCGTTDDYCGWDAGQRKFTCNDTGAQSYSAAAPFACPGAPACVPQCSGKSCGPDGCGGVCGTCTGAGSACVDGQCKQPCGGLAPVEGCCANGTQVKWCPSVDAGPNEVRTMTCDSGGDTCGWNRNINRMSCVYPAREPPAGVLKACPAPPKRCNCTDANGQQLTCGTDDCGNACGTCGTGLVCESGQCAACRPRCSSSDQCGDDGCGGTCGTCKGTMTCNAERTCEGGCDGLSSSGQCDGNTLEYCSPNGEVRVDCTASGRKCESAACTGTKPGVTAKSCAAADCGKQDASWSCQCDAACAERGDCCDTYESVCGAKISLGTCGDGTCNAGSGENLVTCREDCRWEQVETKLPPWPAPFLERIANSGAKDQQSLLVVSPLDDVRPAPAPMPTRGLLAYVPQLGVNAGSPRTTVSSWDAGQAYFTPSLPNLLSSPVELAQARRGAGISFLTTTGGANEGIVRIMPEEPAPRAGRYSDHSAGGATVAFWTKVPAATRTHANPLAAARALQGGAEVCSWSRPGESNARLTCPTGTAIVGVEAYYGDVPGQVLPDGKCSTYRKLEPTQRCFHAGATASVQRKCSGKEQCNVDLWSEAKDPCATSATDTTVRSTLMLRAVCDVEHRAFATLLVEPTNDGGKLRLASPGQGDVRSTRAITSDTWTHVAMAFVPHGDGVGEVVLYVNGQEEARRDGYRFSPTYLWEFGAGWVQGATKDWPTAIHPFDWAMTAKPLNVYGRSQIDEILLYGRTLSSSEVRALSGMADSGPLRVWPSIEAERVARGGLWTAGADVQAVPIEIPQMLDSGRSTPTKTVLVRADHLALGLPAGKTFSAGDTGRDLSNLARFTVAGWLRPQSLTKDTSLFELLQGDASQLKLGIGAECAGGGITATHAGTSASLTANDCAHGLAANEWVFVAYVQDAATRSIFVDGHRMASTTKAGAIFTGDAAAKRSFRAGNGVDLAWAALYDRALTAMELDAYRSTGPAVWMDNLTYAGANEKLVRDWANFHNNASGAATDRVRLTDTSGQALAPTADSRFSDGNAVVRVPARGRFRSPNGTAARSFTWSGSVMVDATNTSSPTPLFQLVNNRQVVAEGRLACTFNAQADLPNGQKAPALTCHVQVEGLSPAAGEANGYRKWASASRTVYDPPERTRAEVVVSFDSPPRIALDFAMERGEPFDLERLARGSTLQEVQVTATSGTARTLSATSVPETGPVFLLPSASPMARAKTYEPGRLYARALSAGELGSLVRTSCKELDCEGNDRECRPLEVFDDAASSERYFCTACTTGFLEHEGRCVRTARVLEPCASNRECGTGVCGTGGVCVDSTESAECKATCGALGRSCQKVPNTETWSCSADCRASFTQVERDGVKHCEWKPSIRSGQPCTSNDQCYSGACADVQTSRYGVTSDAVSTYYSHRGVEMDCADKEGCAVPADWTETSKVCAWENTTVCDAGYMEPVAVRVTPPGSAETVTRYSCSGCSKQKYGDRTLYVERWKLLSSNACKAIYDNRWDLAEAGTVNYWSLQNSEPNLTDLRRYLLNDKNPTSVLHPATFSKLKMNGAGPVVLGWNRLPYAEKRRYVGSVGFLGEDQGGKMDFSLGNCNRTTWRDEEPDGRVTDRYSPFQNKTLNTPYCDFNKFPNGTPCPTPGLANPPDRARAGNTCESGFCAFDNGLCETGYRTYEETQGEDRNDKENKPDNDLGPVQLFQTNQTVLKVAQVEGSTYEDDRSYGLATTNAYTMKIFGFASYDLYDIGVTIATQMGPQTASRSERLKIFGLSAPFSRTATASKCGAVEWDNGEWKKPVCRAARSASGLVDPSATPQATLKIPIPIGGCKEENNVDEVNPFTGRTDVSTEKGRICFKKTTFVGPVPIAIEIGAAMEAAISFGATIDGETMEPGFAVTPSVGIGLEVKGGIGVSEDIGPGVSFGISAGIVAAITLVELAFPVGWTLRVKETQKTVDGVLGTVPDLYKVEFVRDVKLEATFLKVQLGLYFELNLGISLFSFSFEYEIFGFDGIKLVKDLKTDTLSSTKVDFQWVAE